MNKVVLQVPVTAKLRQQAEQAALDEGFSSLQEVVRLFMAKYAKGQLSFNVVKTVQLSPRAIKRYSKILEDIDSGKEKTRSFDSVDDVIAYLNR